MNFKLLASFLFVLALTNPLIQASAACDPCKCGPGGSYPGDIDQWIRDNCSHHPNPPPPDGNSLCDNPRACLPGYQCQIKGWAYAPEAYQCIPM